MKKFLTSMTILAVIFIVATSVYFLRAEKNKPVSNPLEELGDYVPEKVNTLQKAKGDIASATQKEDAKLKSALEQAGISDSNSEKTDNNQNQKNMEQKNPIDSVSGPGDNSALVAKYPFALIKTSMGNIKVELDGKNAPVAAGNFLKLAQDGFYDGTKFHRVIPNFMIQGGDPLSKDNAQKDKWGTGGPGYKFPDELKGDEKYTQGTLAMANSGPDTNGSQFFIVTADPSYALQPNYTVFGEVVSGMDIALEIEKVKTTGSSGSPADQPIEDVVIKNIEPMEK